MTRPLNLLRIMGTIVLLGVGATLRLAAGDGFHVETAPEWDELFQRDSGWTGADGDFSVAMGHDTTLWLFSDTFVGSVSHSHRTNSTMIHNSIALQHGREKPEFHYGVQAGKAAAFVSPQDGRGYFWLFSGARATNGLHLFLQQVESVKPGGAFGFKIVATWLGWVANPDDPPAQWKISQRQLPFGNSSTNGHLLFGSAILRDGGYFYIYGDDSRATRNKSRGSLIVARVPEARLEDFTQWRFFGNGRWSEDAKQVSGLGASAASECSVSYVPALKKYALIYSSGIWGKIMLQLASAPTGPWQKPLLLYECPEQKWPGQVYCYAGKAHPELSSAPDELLITYAANSWSLGNLMNDVRLYWPRFIRVKFIRETK